jgi:hypothetical protein
MSTNLTFFGYLYDCGKCGITTFQLSDSKNKNEDDELLRAGLRQPLFDFCLKRLNRSPDPALGPYAVVVGRVGADYYFELRNNHISRIEGCLDFGQLAVN